MRHRRFDWVKFFVITGLIVLIIGAIGVYAKLRKSRQTAQI